MIPMILGWLAKSALMQSPAGALLKKIPAQVWLALAIAMLIGAAVLWHQHSAHKALKSADAAGYARAKAEDDAALKLLRQRAAEATTNLAKISQDERTRNANANRDTDARADAVLLHGPGKASCGRVGDPALPASAGGRDPASGSANAAVDPVPDRERPELIAVPFAELVDRARQCDLDRNEVVSRRSADTRNREEWDKLKAGSK